MGDLFATWDPYVHSWGASRCGGRTWSASAREKVARDDIQQMLEMQFGWSGFITNLGLDGVIGEMQ